MGVFGSHQKQTEGSTTNTSSTASFSIVFNRFSACDSFPSFFSKRCCTYDLHHDCMVRSALVNAPLLATPPAPRYASARYRPRKSLACPSPWNVLVCVHRNVLSGKVRAKVANGLRAPRVTTRITRRPKTLATAYDGSRSRRCVNLTCDHVATVRRGYRGQRQLRGNTSTARWEHIHSTSTTLSD